MFFFVFAVSIISKLAKGLLDRGYLMAKTFETSNVAFCATFKEPF